MTLLKNRTSWTLSTLLTLLLLTPGVSLAGEDAPVASPPLVRGQHEYVPQYLREEPEDDRTHPVLRVGAEIGAHALTAVPLSLVGALAAGGLCETFHLQSGWFACLDYMAYGFLTGTVLAAPLGIWWGGRLADGRGTLGGAFLGTGLGTVAGILASFLVYNDNLAPSVTIPFLGAVIGSYVGYEISHGRASSRTRLQPIVALSPNSGTLGLSGQF